MKMKNIKLVIAYDGTRYNGWQKQGNTKNTIQEKLEEILSKLMGEKIEVIGSGRTDAGVHAIGQVANFKIKDKLLKQFFKEWENEDIEYGLKNVHKELNRYLPQDIRIISVSEENERFHARLNAIGKHYSYRIDNGEISEVFLRKYLLRIEEKLDLDKMRNAAQMLIGEHDFKSFCANKKMKKSTVRTIYKIEITKDKGIVKIDFYGNGFLYNMIRIMVGTLIEIGLSKRNPNDIKRILETGSRSEAGYLVSGNGLFLEEVYYDKIEEKGE